MAMIKYGAASLIDTGLSPDNWVNAVYDSACSNGRCRMKTARSVIAKYDPKKYLLSHCSIMAAVDVDEARTSESQYKDYLVKPEYTKFINNNGDAWTKQMLEAAHRTFIGCNNYCFPAGTRVLMSNGTYKPIEEIKDGDRVINRKGEPAKVTRVFQRESSDLVEISGKSILSRSFFVTKDHPFWVYRARKICPKTGRPNHFDVDINFSQLISWKGFAYGVHTGKNEEYSCGVTPAWVEAGNIDPNRDFFTHPVSTIEIEHEEINENRARLIGWFLAEGSYMSTNKFSDRESGIVFNLGNDEIDVANRLKDLLVEEFGQHFRVDCEPRIFETESGSYCLYLSNQVVSDFFMKWCGKYAWGKVMPEEAMWLPKKLQSIIIHNCIHGDGSSKIKSRGFILELKSQKLIQQLLWISWRLGIKPTYRETGVLSRYTDSKIIDGYEIFTDPETGKKSRPGYMLRFSTRDSKTLCEASGYFDNRIYSRCSNRCTHIFSSEEGNWIVSKIKRVSPVSDVNCDVYNIEVEDDNSYIVEGIVVHNCEHVQIPELSKGKVIDSVLREVPIGKDKYANDLTTYYVDILVATDRKHKELVRQIQSNEMSTLSMGCIIKFSICTKCGKRAVDESEACQHVRYEKNNMFYDENGVQRKVAELCGHASEPESVRFVDASWVKQPAFTGAVLRDEVKVPVDIMAKLEAAQKIEGYEKKEGDFLKAASHLIAQEPGEETPTEEEETGEPAPAEEPPAEAPAEEAPAEGAPAEDVPPEEGMPSEEPESMVDKMKEKIKKDMLEQVRDELEDEFSEEGERPEELETLDESIIKPASVFKKVWGAKLSWDRYVKQATHGLDKINFDRLRYGTYMLLTNDNPTILANYGYNKRDFLAVMSFLDERFKNPLPRPIKKTIAKLGGTHKKGPVELLSYIVSSIGRKVSRDEAQRSLMWLSLLDHFKD